MRSRASCWRFLLIVASVRCLTAAAQEPCAPSTPFPLRIAYHGTVSGCMPSNGRLCHGGEPIEFSAWVPNEAPQPCDRYSWSFGDGTTTSEPMPVHVFPATGERFRVAVTVMSPGRWRSASADVLLDCCVPTIAPLVVEFKATPNPVVVGGFVDLTWSVRDARRVRLEPFSYEASGGVGSFRVRLFQKQTFRLIAYGDAASGVASVTVDVEYQRRRGVRH